MFFGQLFFIKSLTTYHITYTFKFIYNKNNCLSRRITLIIGSTQGQLLFCANALQGREKVYLLLQPSI